VDAIAVFRQRTAAINSQLHAFVDELRDAPLGEQVVPGTSPLGLTLWHIPRTQDWLLNTVIRAEPEVAQAHLDGLPDPDLYGFGTGLTGDQATEAARQVELPALLTYSDAVTASLDQWLASCTEADLDAVPPLLERQSARAAYTTPEALEEVEGLAGLPIGVLLQRPTLGHLFWHLGEVDLLLQLLPR
jgi:hypothetical protein